MGGRRDDARPRPSAPASRVGVVRLVDRTEDTDNNFDLLRLITALAVIVSHSFAVVGDAEPLHQFHTTLGSAGVLVFFAVSGLLIHRSWHRDPRPAAYWNKRVLRVWPALVVATVGTALALGPLVTSAPLRVYFSSWETWTYPLWFVLMTPFGAELPGVFVDLPASRAVNGSLWTLHVEVMAYGLLCVLGVARVLDRRTTLTLLTAAALAWSAYIVTPTQPNLGTTNALAAFGIGACAWSWRERIVLCHSGALAALVSCGATAAGPDPLRVVTWTLGAAYLSLWFAYAVPRVGRRLTQWGDASYGLYIFAFPIQQTIVHVLGADTTPWTVVTLATPITWLLALGSWRLVERPALRRKKTPATVRGMRQERAEPCFHAAGERFQSP